MPNTIAKSQRTMSWALSCSATLALGAVMWMSYTSNAVLNASTQTVSQSAATSAGLIQVSTQP